LTLRAGVAYHIAEVCNTDNSVDFYVNGTFIAKVAGALGDAGAGPFIVGYNVGRSTVDGNIYLGDIYSRALSAAEIKTLFAASGLLQVRESSDWGSPVSTAARGGITAGYLEQTGWQFGSTVPRYSVATSTVQGKTVKTISCSTAGHLYRAISSQTTGPQAAYGTWEWTFIKSAGGDIYFMPVASDKIEPGLAGNNGYFVRVDSNEKVWLYKVAGVTLTPLLSTGNDYVVAGSAYTFRLTRTFTGIWTLWIRGLAATPGWTLVSNAGGGTNPTAAENTYTSSQYQVMYMRATDMISLGSVDGDYAMSWSPFIP
jgi:hypothetical protein